MVVRFVQAQRCAVVMYGLNSAYEADRAKTYYHGAGNAAQANIP